LSTGGSTQWLPNEDAFAEHACRCCEHDPPVDEETQARREQCSTCSHALGWHQCEYEPDDETQWHAGTLHESKLDVSSALWALARRFVPLDILKRKLDEYIAEGHLDAEKRMRTWKPSNRCEAFSEKRMSMAGRNYVIFFSGSHFPTPASIHCSPYSNLESKGKSRIMAPLELKGAVNQDPPRVLKNSNKVKPLVRKTKQCLRSCLKTTTKFRRQV